MADLAKRWISYWEHSEGTLAPEDSDANTMLDGLVRDDPETCWQTILAILEKIEADPSIKQFQVLAAGPLEDLLTEHGPNIIAKVELQARRDPKFNFLLGGVWQNAMNNDIWSRVQAIRNKVW
ncbi:MAG: hypothetical protein K0M66_01165 [Thiobacillus sp.]|nr:hypothetical protein [Thiobacillus sp.]